METDSISSGSPPSPPVDGVYGSTLEQRARQYALSIMAQHTFEEAKKQKYICDLRDENTGKLLLQGVALRICKEEYTFYPQNMPEIYPWVESLKIFNVGVSQSYKTEIPFYTFDCC